MSDATRREWVSRVLGVDVAAQPDARARLAAAGAELRQLRASGDGRAGALVDLMAAANRALKSDPVAAELLAAQLEAGIALARSAARGREAAALNPRGVALPKLQLHWRQAQSRAYDDLMRLGDALLNDPDVQAEPRFPEVQDFVGDLPTMLPLFGTRLEDALDSMTNAGPGDAATQARAVAAVQAYRKEIEGTPLLTQLEAFAAGQLGLNLSIFGALEAALFDIEQALNARTKGG